jgi:hypothetical protein
MADRSSRFEQEAEAIRRETGSAARHSTMNSAASVARTFNQVRSNPGVIDIEAIIELPI